MNRLLKIVLCSSMLLYSGPGHTRGQDAPHLEQDRVRLSAGEDFVISPYTGYTREHWLEITEKIIAGALSQFNNNTGFPELRVRDGFAAYDRMRWKSPVEETKRILERMMMAVVIYTSATGRDEVPGFKGSISRPFMDAMINGTDPEHPGYWGAPPEYDQVGSTFALAVYLDPERYWDPLTDSQKTNLLNFLQQQVHTKAYDNNHYYFHTVPVELLDREGFTSNSEHLFRMNERLMGWYRGDGWFIDGSNRGFDHYNLWGFQLFNQVLYRFNPQWRERFGERIEHTTERFLETALYLYGRDGGPIPWGRSLSYRFAGNAAIAWAVLNEMNILPPGQARRLASGSLKYFWERGCLDDNQLLAIGYWGANASVAESYLCYGDGYWAAHGLACLLIPEKDPFWTATEEPIPADGAGGRRAVRGAQFTLRVSDTDGEARLFPVGQPFAHKRDKWQTAAKYDQHAYSGYLGFCVLGEGGGNIGAGRSGYSHDGRQWYYRERAQAILVSEDLLASTYKVQPENQDEIVTYTIVGNDGEIHVFWHNHPEPVHLHLGGYGLSLSARNELIEYRSDSLIRISGNGYSSLVQVLMGAEGKCSSELLIPREGWVHSHLFGGTGAYPYWTSAVPVPPNTPQVLYVNGARDREIEPVDAEIISEEGTLTVHFEGRYYSIQIPY